MKLYTFTPADMLAPELQGLLTPLYDFGASKLNTFMPNGRTAADQQYARNGAQDWEQDASFVHYLYSVPANSLVVLDGEYLAENQIGVPQLSRWLAIGRAHSAAYKKNLTFTSFGLWDGTSREWAVDEFNNKGRHPEVPPRAEVVSFYNSLDIIPIEIYSTGAQYEERDTAYANIAGPLTKRYFEDKPLMFIVNHDSVHRSAKFQSAIQKAAKAHASRVAFWEPVSGDVKFVQGFVA